MIKKSETTEFIVLIFVSVKVNFVQYRFSITPFF